MIYLNYKHTRDKQEVAMFLRKAVTKFNPLIGSKAVGRSFKKVFLEPSIGIAMPGPVEPMFRMDKRGLHSDLLRMSPLEASNTLSIGIGTGIALATHARQMHLAHKARCVSLGVKHKPLDICLYSGPDDWIKQLLKNKNELDPAILNSLWGQPWKLSPVWIQELAAKRFPNSYHPDKCPTFEEKAVIKKEILKEIGDLEGVRVIEKKVVDVQPLTNDGGVSEGLRVVTEDGEVIDHKAETTYLVSSAYTFRKPEKGSKLGEFANTIRDSGDIFSDPAIANSTDPLTFIGTGLNISWALMKLKERPVIAIHDSKYKINFLSGVTEKQKERLIEIHLDDPKTELSMATDATTGEKFWKVKGINQLTTRMIEMKIPSECYAAQGFEMQKLTEKVQDVKGVKVLNADVFDRKFASEYKELAGSMTPMGSMPSIYLAIKHVCECAPESMVALQLTNIWKSHIQDEAIKKGLAPFTDAFCESVAPQVKEYFNLANHDITSIDAIIERCYNENPTPGVSWQSVKDIIGPYTHNIKHVEFGEPLENPPLSKEEASYLEMIMGGLPVKFQGAPGVNHR